MKRIFAMFMAIVMCASLLAGCGSGGSDNETAPETEPAAGTESSATSEPSAETEPAAEQEEEPENSVTNEAGTFTLTFDNPDESKYIVRLSQSGGAGVDVNIFRNDVSKGKPLVYEYFFNDNSEAKRYLKDGDPADLDAVMAATAKVNETSMKKREYSIGEFFGIPAVCYDYTYLDCANYAGYFGIQGKLFQVTATMDDDESCDETFLEETALTVCRMMS